MANARERIDHQQDVPAARAEIFRDSRGHERRAQTQQRRLVRSGYYDDGALAALFAERLFQKFAHFAAAFADQRDYRQVRRCAARHHADQRAFADAAAAENSHALAAPAREHSINRADAAAQRLADRRCVRRGCGGEPRSGR